MVLQPSNQTICRLDCFLRGVIEPVLLDDADVLTAQCFLKMIQQLYFRGLCNLNELCKITMLPTSETFGNIAWSRSCRVTQLLVEFPVAIEAWTLANVQNHHAQLGCALPCSYLFEPVPAHGTHECNRRAG